MDFLFAALIVLLSIGAGGGRARFALKKRFGRDFTLDAVGSCVVLIVGAQWGLAQDGESAKALGAVLVLLALACGYMVLGALMVGAEKPSALRWVLYFLAGTAVAFVLAFLFLMVGL